MKMSALVAVLLMCAHSVAAAPAVEAPAVEAPAAEAEESGTLLSPYADGPRKRLSDRGIDLELVYKAEYVANVQGGLKRDDTYLGNVDFRVRLDGEKAFGWKGGSGLLYILADHGGHPSRFVGDAQVTSNIDAPAATVKVYEAWLQQSVLEDKVSVLAGLHDLNSEFYSTETSGLFFNSSFGVGKELSQTGVNGPSIFPTAALAARLKVEPAKSFYLQGAVFNAQSGNPGNHRGTHVTFRTRYGSLWITEAAYLRGQDEDGRLRGKYGIGFWHYTNTFDHLSAKIQTDPADPTATVPVQATSHGTYFLADQGLTDSLSVFLRYGIASSGVNRFYSCLGTGAVYTGMVPRRPKDSFGVAVATAKNGKEYKASQRAAGSLAEDAETVVEVNYRVEVRPGLAIQPDFQRVIDPGTTASLRDASVFGVRVELSF